MCPTSSKILTLIKSFLRQLKRKLLPGQVEASPVGHPGKQEALGATQTEVKAVGVDGDARVSGKCCSGR